MALAAAEKSAPLESAVPADKVAGDLGTGEKPAADQPAKAAAPVDPAANTTSSTAAPDEHHWYDAGALGYMIAGGLFMWPILFMGILAAGVSIERWRSLKLLNVDTSPLRSKVLDLLHADRGEEVL